MENCMFLRECVCLRTGPGECNKCGNKNQYSEQEGCWYCDCDCGVETCMIDRNPSKKYFKVQDTETLFNNFMNLKMDIQNLAAIVQNEMVIDLEQLKEWLNSAGTVQREFTTLIKSVTAFILKNQVAK